MTLEKIASNLEKWQAQRERLQARLDKENECYEKDKERYNRVVNKITCRLYALKQKIEKYKPYKSYYEREVKNENRCPNRKKQSNATIS